MEFRSIPLSELIVNPANDRHGDQGNEKAAIEWLFSNKASEMHALIEDVAAIKGILDPPLVFKKNDQWIVYDGNRRVAAMKALAGLITLPAQQSSRIESAKSEYNPAPDVIINCQIGKSLEIVNTTLSRRHGGTDGGRGQLRWDPRAKANYAKRVGANSQYPIAEAVEEWLADNGYPHAREIKRSTLFRLINTKGRQAQFGISLGENGKLKFLRGQGEVFNSLSTVADDIVRGDLTLNNVLNTEGINKYLARPHVSETLQSIPKPESEKDPKKRNKKVSQRRPSARDSLIPRDVTYSLQWQPGQGKIKALWEELTYDLSIRKNPITIALAFRALIELVATDSGPKLGIQKGKSMAGFIQSISSELAERGALQKEALRDFHVFCTKTSSPREYEALHRSVHGPGHIAAADDLIAMWHVVEPFLLAGISYQRA